VAWHALPLADVQRRLRVDGDGLTAAEAAARLRRHGANAVEAIEPRTGWRILIAQVASVPSLLLLGAAGFSLVIGDLVDAGVIVAVVLLNAGIGYHVERQNEDLLASWRRLEAGAVEVIRGGQPLTVPAVELVPGDRVLLRAGDIAPADLRVLESQRLAVDQSALTGESCAQPKGPEPVPDDALLGARSSIVHAGTAVVSGRGHALVVATGRDTELAAIRRLVGEARVAPTPMEERLAELGRRATAIGLSAATLMAVGGFVRGHPAAAVVRTAVALGIAAIPEGLPLVCTAALVNAMRRMAGHGIVVRRLAAAETLGSVTVVCVDKTGTLTENDMRLEVLQLDGQAVPLHEVRAHSGEPFASRASLALAAAALNSDVELRSDRNGLSMSGSSTERALISGAERAGLNVPELVARYPRRQLQERSNGVHYVVSVHDGPDGQLAFLKGAPEQVLPLCAYDQHSVMDRRRRKRIQHQNDALARNGYRVLAIAWKPRLTGETVAATIEPGAAGFEFIGLVGLRDRLREGSADAVQQAARVGIRSLILTGDQQATALAVARSIGLQGTAQDGGELLAGLSNGGEVDGAALDGVAVLSRVSPADKLAIVQALKDRGEIVAMVGDGINDAPALKLAHVGIAVGQGASEIARQTADVVLQEPDLRAVLTAVGEGRLVQDHLSRVVRFLFASNFSEVLVMLGGLLLPRAPLTAIQLLWINLVSDSLPALALGLEPGDPLALALAPAPAGPAEAILGRGEWGKVARDGALLALLGAAALALGGRTAAFVTLTSAQLGYALACRPEERPAGSRFLSLWGSAVGGQALAVLLPPLRALLGLRGSLAVAAAGMAGGLLAAPLAASGAGHTFNV
jgi:Ca2+-transporting ATPase